MSLLEGRGRSARRATAAALLALVCSVTAVGEASANTDWLDHRILNIAHQGGEDEAPSNAMFTYARAMRLGADMLEVDVHTSADGDLMVIHDGTVDRTTNGSGSIYEMTTAEIQALDAAYWFVPGEGTTHSADPADYVFRGVRTGFKQPPPAARAKQFRIPTLAEVMAKYPTVPINIEIKGAADTNQQSFLDNAEALAAFLNELGRTEGIVVASFSDAAAAHFHQLAPQIDLAASTAAVAAYKGAGVPPPPGTKAFQVPIEFGGVSVTDEQFIVDAHEDNLAVHVWTINDEPTMNQLLDWNADGIMTAVPTRLERVLCEAGAPRPARPASYGGRHCSIRASIACDVEATAAKHRNGALKVTLRRHDEFEGRCAGRIALTAIGTGQRQVARFDMGELAPSAGGPAKAKIKIRPRGRLRGASRTGKKVRFAARPYGAFVHRSAVRVG